MPNMAYRDLLVVKRSGRRWLADKGCIYRYTWELGRYTRSTETDIDSCENLELNPNNKGKPIKAKHDSRDVGRARKSGN